MRSRDDVRVVYSRAATYIELVEGKERSYFAIGEGEGFHDIGLWVERYDCALCKKRFGGLQAQMPGIADPARILTAPQAVRSMRTEM